MLPEISVAFGAKFQIPVAKQGGREMLTTRPHETNPFHPLEWFLITKQAYFKVLCKISEKAFLPTFWNGLSSRKLVILLVIFAYLKSS